MSLDMVFPTSQFPWHWIGMCFLIVITSRTIMIPVAIMLHEMGHLVVTRFEKIPVLKYEIGNGSEFLAFRFCSIDWSFHTNIRSGGAVHIPRLIPTTDKNWRSIERIVMAGPATNLLCVAVFGFLGLAADTDLQEVVFFSLAYANWILVNSAKNDYLMAQAARNRDRKAMEGFYLEGVYEYRMS